MLTRIAPDLDQILTRNVLSEIRDQRVTTPPNPPDCVRGES